MSQSSLSFSLPSPSRYGTRIGAIALRRNAETVVNIPAPGLLATTSRGAISHLSRDHVRITDSIRWVNVPFETFLEHNPPTPTLYAQQSNSPHPLHSYLGLVPAKHLVSVSARDPLDSRDMPPNGNAQLCVSSLRGVRKLTPTEWTTYVRTVQPDVVFAMADTPFTNPPYSQKRLTKAIERGAAWLTALLRPGPISIPYPVTKKSKSKSKATKPSMEPTSPEKTIALPPTPPVFVQLAGLTSSAARKAFSTSLLEPLYGPDADALSPLTTLDEGVAGYVIDLVPLKQALEALDQKETDGSPPSLNLPSREAMIIELIQSSLATLPPSKPRIITGVTSPHEILHYISTVGIDLFDAGWAQKAADVGVALDFEFPAKTRNAEGKKREIGHNIYDVGYRLDFRSLSDSARGALEMREQDVPVCPCASCSPLRPLTRVYHGHDTPNASGEPPFPGEDASVAQNGAEVRDRHLPHYSRAYIHHLLHTHEMSAHTFLAMHNLAVLDAFFAGIRSLVVRFEGKKDAGQLFEDEVRKFGEVYDAKLSILAEARARWREVDLARGKGRLLREKGKDVDGAIELENAVEAENDVEE